MYSNVDQLLNKIDDLKSQIADYTPDLMFFTEVIPKAQRNPIHEPLLIIPGFECFTNFDFTQSDLGASGIRGVAIYVNEKLEREEITLNTQYQDQIWIEIKLKGKDKLLCGSIYRSPTKEKDRTISTTLKMCDILNEVSQRNPSHLLICGDFNYPEIDWVNEHVNEFTPIISPFIDVIQEANLYQHITRPTRYRHNQEPSLLDLIFTNEEGMLSELIHKPGLGDSDHECLYFHLNCYASMNERPKGKNYRKGDYATIRSRLETVDWLEKLRGNFSTAYETFIGELFNAMEGCIPDYSNTKKGKNIYLTPDALRKKDLKNKLWKRYKKSGSIYDHRRFTQVKNELRALTRKLRFNLEKKIAKDIKTSPKQFWAYVNSRTKTRKMIPALTKDDGSIANTAKEKAETLNIFFSSVFTKEDTNNIPKNNSVAPFLGNPLDKFEITFEMVLKKLQELKPDKSPGPDGWHPIYLKNVADLISLPLSIVFQKSLNEGILPSDWLKACVTAIYKKGQKDLPDNYRPVSITSIICKLMESIVRDKIVEHMTYNNLFSKKQHGFVPKKNCMTNLLICIEMWTQLLEDGEAVDVIYTDFSKAFDSVPHLRLLQKMTGLGITGSTLAWVEAFLSHRMQRVHVEGSYSSWTNVISGIPQGSVLGPILFVIFINDMPDTVESMCQLFADDAKLFSNVHIRNESNITKLQEDLDKLVKWSETWQLPFNIKKCISLHIGRNNPWHQYKMNGKRLNQVYEEKDLGILMDNELKFHKHTSAVVKKASRNLGIIKKSFLFLDASTLSTLYKSLVRSHLEYGNVVWGPTYKGDIIAVERVQRRATKLIREIKHLPYEERLKSLRLPSLCHRRRRGDMIFTYKLHMDKLGIDKKEFFTSPPNRLVRGHQFRIMKQKATKTCRISSYANRVIADWNSLPTKVISANTTDMFKDYLDEHWKNESYISPF